MAWMNGFKKIMNTENKPPKLVIKPNVVNKKPQSQVDEEMTDVKPQLAKLEALIDVQPVDEKPLLDVKPFVEEKVPLAELNSNLLRQINQNTQPQSTGAKKTTKKKNQKGKKKNGENSGDENEASQMRIVDDKAEDQMGVVETYADYKPAKLDYGQPHPDPVVETSSLSSVPPTDIKYKLMIPKETIDKGALSALQLESIIYASQAHEHILADDKTRAGFLIGDGAGVGKGRTVAGIIFENFLRGRKKAIWVSVSNDLKYDAERDLEDIGADDIEVYALNKFKYAKISSYQNGRVTNGVVFATYSSLISGTQNAMAKFNTRLKQLVDWFGADFDGCIIFDECHKAKHLIPTNGALPTKTGRHVLELQNLLPKARVVYASATGASEPANMAYMVRLGLWGEGTPFKKFPQFLNAVEKRGVSAMELVAMDMKLRGMYIARQLSFKGVTFTVDEVPFSADYQQIYNDSVELWVEAKNCFGEAAVLLEGHPKFIHSMWAQFWSAHQRFFKYLCISAKVGYAVQLAKKSIEDGKCVIIGLQSTGEARTLDVVEREGGDLTEFVSTAKSVFEAVMENHFPAPARKFLDNLQNSNKPTSSQNSQNSQNSEPILKRTRGSNLKRRVLAGLEFPLSAKKRRVVYTDDSEEEVEAEKSKKSVKRSKSIPKKRSVLDSDSESDVEMLETEKPTKTKKSVKTKKTVNTRNSRRLRRRIESSSDSHMSDSGESRAGDNDSSDDKNAKVSSSESESESDYDSDASGSIYNSDAMTTSNESDASTIGSDDSGDEESSDYDSDLGMEVFETGRSTGKTKTMQEKIHEILMSQSGPQAARIRGYCKRACELKDALLEQIDLLGKQLPPNTLDQLIAELGGPDQVAEMTGRKGRVVKMETDEIQYESRAEYGVSMDELNLLEKKRFMDGEKLIAIISEAASNGISLQSDRRVKNQRRRVHITLELPWSADRAIQQFGRSHRSNQVNAPEYVFLISDLAGERRFASSVSKRLESLGALTHADRRATETRQLSQFNVDNKYGREALQTIMHNILLDAEIKQMEDKEKVTLFLEIRDALRNVGIGEDPIAKIEMSRFLNRILGMPVRLQNAVFDHFVNTLDDIIQREKDAGKFDMGILDMGNTENVEKIWSTRFERKHATGTAPIEVTTVAVNRGISWEEALEKFGKATNDYEGFHLTHFRNNRSVTLHLSTDSGLTNDDLKYMKPREIFFNAYRPHTGAQTRLVPLNEVQRNGTKLNDLDKAKMIWENHYTSSVHECFHSFYTGRCYNIVAGGTCDEGMRRRKYTVLSGSIFAVWDRILHHLHKLDHFQSPRVVRLKTTDGGKIVGVLLPNKIVSDVIDDLHEDSEDFEEFNYMDD